MHSKGIVNVSLQCKQTSPSVSGQAGQCKESTGEKMILRIEGIELGRLIYFSKFSNQIRFSFERKNKQEGRE